jgi:hypothetical protein
MADIRFQISGDSAPFTAKLYLAGSGTVLQQMAIDNSGITTCCVCANKFPVNIFNDLNGNTCYCVVIRDSIGHTASFACTTPAAPAPLVLPTKNLTLTGQPSAPPMTTYYCVATGVISISPALSSGQCVGVCLTACTRGGGTCGVNSNVTISCHQDGTPSGTWVVKNTYNNLNAISATNIPLCCGDALCYSMSVSCCAGCTGNLCGCAKLAIKSVTGCSTVIAVPSGQQSVNMGISYTTTTTTTTTTVQPIGVFLTNAAYQVCSPTSVRACAKLVVSPPLTGNQCFRLCFRDCARSNSNTTSTRLMSACSYATCVTTTACNLASTSLGDFITGNDIDICENYITVTSANINSITFYTRATSHAINATLPNVNCSSVCLYAIACQCCGVYVFGEPANQYMTVHTANVSTPEGGQIPVNIY